MVKFLVLWNTPEDPVAFERHYRDVQIPLIKQLPNLRRWYCQLIERMEELVKEKDEGKKRSRRRGVDNAVLCRSYCFGDPRFRSGIGSVKWHGIPQHADGAFAVENVPRSDRSAERKRCACLADAQT